MMSRFILNKEKGFLVLIVITFALNLCQCLETSYLTTTDKDRLKQVFVNNLSHKDLIPVHYSILGLKLLNEKITNLQEVCKVLTEAVTSKTSLDVYYHVAVAWTAAVCPGTLPVAQMSKVLLEVFEKEGASASELYYATHALKAIKQPIGQASKIAARLQAALKKDESVISFGYGLHTAAELGPTDGNFIYSRIQEMIKQADEVDGKYLQYEGGLSVTAITLSGVYRLAAVLNKSPDITSPQLVKLTNYFVSRKSVQTPKGAYNLLNVLQTLAKNKFQRPARLTVERAGQGQLSLRVCDVLGAPLSTQLLPVLLESLKTTPEASVLASKIKFEQSPTDKVIYIAKLPAEIRPGVYKAAISITPSDKTIIAETSTLKVTITGELAVTEPLLIAAADSDHVLQPKYNKVAYPGKLGEVLEIDSLQRLSLRFSLKEKTSGKPLVVHQAFVRLAHSLTKQELIFVAERDSSNGYKLDLDIGAKASEFNHLSGVYTVEVIAGDQLLSNALRWHVADVNLSFPTGQPDPQTDHMAMYRPRPEIKITTPHNAHVFRVPEKRPPVFVSNLFTGLVFLPLLILFILWLKLGINISNFSFRLSTLGFHLGLGAIFGLFGLFWLQLNMFETLKYLLVLGLVTFLSGNKLLASIAARHHKS